MSQTKKFKFQFLFILLMVSFFAFGCKNETPVEDICFNIDSGNQIVLIVGQTLRMDEYVTVSPSYATNKGYSITSFDENLVKVENNSLIALKEGNALIKVVSNDNVLKEDMMTVVVKSHQEQLKAPLNFEYNSESQVVSFDPVQYASSYTLKINGQIIDLGNSTSYNLSEYNGEIFDTLLIMQVRANAPAYSFALQTSDYSSEKKVYQAGAVKNLRVEGGVVKFDKYSEDNIHDVYFNNIIMGIALEENYLTLDDINDIYVGQTVNCKVNAVVSDKVKQKYGLDVLYFNSNQKSVPLNILDVPEMRISASKITWQNVAHADGYAVSIDNQKCAEIKQNYFDLQTLQNFESLITSGKVHTVSVRAVLGADSVGVAQTNKAGEIKVQRLNAPTIYCDGTDIKWNSVENASVYSITLTGANVELKSSTAINSLSMANYVAGDYLFEIISVANDAPDEDGVHFISSRVTQKELTKHNPVSLNIENYVLNLSNLGQDACEVLFDDAEIDNSYKIKDEKLDLSNEDFAAGLHTITVKRLGDHDHIESDLTSISFTQLEKIENVRIGASIASVVRSTINQNAKIYLVTTGSKINEIRVEQTGYSYNSENENLKDYLPAGNDYVTRVYVEGDGSSTFSYRENGEVVSCCEARFEVLSAPSSFAIDKQDPVLTFESTAERYNIYKNNNAVPISANTNRYPFVLESGSVSFKVRSLGNGSTTLNSALSEEVVVSRLEKPTLSYNNSNNVISKNDTNDVSKVEGYLFTHNNEVVSGYKFGEEAISLKDATQGNEFTLTALAVDASENNFYLNSKTFTLTLSQINNVSNISLNGLSNDLVIVPVGHREQYNLVVEFTLNDGSQDKVVEFTTKIDEQTGAKVLSNGLEGEEEIVLPYTYSNRYIIKLIDENFNARISETNSEFKVRVRYFKPSTSNDLLINSEYSESATLSLTRISSETAITINTSNQIVLTPTGHTQQFGIVGVAMVSDSLGYIVESNGEGKLVCNKYIQISGAEQNIGTVPTPVELTYVYRGGSYLINVLDENFESIIPGLNSTVSLKVKYSFAHNGVVTDLDSDYCNEKTITIQQATELSREEQNIKIKNIKETYTYQNYSLLVNNYPVALDARAVNENGYIVFDINYLYSKVPANKLTDINVVEVITKNIETTLENPILSVKGGKISVAKTQTITLSNNKYNNNEDNLNNNSTYIFFDTYETTYNKKYTIEIYNNAQKVYTKDYLDTDVSNGLISFYIDEIEELSAVSGMLEIVGYVSTIGADNNVEMFNSANSNKLYINKILAPANLSVSNNILSFATTGNAVGYEVYEKTGVGYIKLNAQLLTSNYFSLTELVGVKNIVVKAISQTGNYSNSSYSEVITINKVASPTVAVANGKINITFPYDMMILLSNPSVNISLKISNGSSNNVTLDMNNLDGRDLKLVGLTTLQAEPYLFMSYNNASLTSEKLTLKINISQANAVNGVYYVSPDDVSLDCCGLFAPTNIKKTTNENDSVEIISWTANSKNILQGNDLSVGYIFKIEYSDGLNDYTYYSDDTNLKYYDETNKIYVSYPAVITGTSAIFPAGYGVNEDGSLITPFGPGVYRISVQSVPLSSISGYNLCNSKYSSVCRFEIMTASVLGVEQGKVVWNAQPFADHYVISIYEQGGTTPVFVDNNVRTTEFDFSNKNLDALTGVYRVVVKAISIREDTLNSAESAPLYVYRIPQAEKAEIDDGRLIVSATAFFEEIEVELFDIETNTTYMLPTFRNVNLQANLQNLKVNGESITTWAEFTNDAVINSATKFSIDLNGDVLNILDGRDYSINVRLIGNSDSNLGIISTVKTTTLSNMKATKLKPIVANVDLGTITFKPDGNYATISADGTYTSIIEPHYSFNGAKSSEFWNMTTVYKIVLSTAGGLNTVYAVDYYSFTTALKNGNIQESEYELVDGEYGLFAWVKYPYSEGGTQKTLYFHVFTNNEISLRNYDAIVHYSMIESVVNGENRFSCSNESSKISLIGTIVVDIYMLGGDSFEKNSEVLGYLSAKSNDLAPFECYENNVLTSYEGQVQFNNLTPVVNGTVIDYPVYKLEVSLLNNQSEEYVDVFYVYHTTEEEAKEIAKRHDPEKYLDAIYMQATINDENSNILFDLSAYYVAGTYKVAIKTLAGMGNGTVVADDYLINSRGNSTQVYQKLTDSNFYINAGVLSFKQSYIVNDGQNIYYNNYEITLEDKATQTTYVYSINKDSEGVSINEGTATISYVLPARLSIDNKLVTFDGGKEYEIKVRAIAKDGLILNGTYKQENGEDVKLKFEKSLGISEVNNFKLRIEDGMLKWKVLDLENYTETVINIAFLDENKQTKIIEFTVQDLTKYVVDGEYQYHYHQFTDGKYNYISSGGTEIKDKIIYVGESNATNIVYAITAYTKGKTVESRNIINSNVTSVVTATRLSPVEVSSIKTVDGSLTWNAVQGAESYKVLLSGLNNYEFVVDSTTINFLEEGFEIEPGVYDIQIKVNGQASISSMMSNPKAAGFEQLKEVELNSIKIQDNKIVWNPVENATAYKVVFEYTNLLGNFTQIERVVLTTEFIAPNDISGLFSIAISAVSVAEAKQFNGHPTVFTSSSEAPVQVANFEFDDINNMFMIDVTETDFLSGDKLLLIYNFTEYSSQGEKETTLVTKTITYKQNGMYEKLEDGTYRYLYPITVIGKYANISVQVARAGTVPSNALKVNDVDFNIFAYGAGIAENPYVIKTAEQLLNIERFTAAHYLLKSSINMSNVNIEERINKYGAIICDEFSGVINGASDDNYNFSIYGFNLDVLDKTDTITLNNAESFALFRAVNGATIKNLTLGSENIQLILVNTFAKNITNVVKLSMIATGANNSLIDNVNILNVKMVLNADNNVEISQQLYVAGLVADSVGTTIANSNVNITTELNITCTSTVYIGGAIAKSNLSNVNNSALTLSISSKADNLIYYVGGCVAYFEGNTEGNSGIRNTNVGISISNVKVMYLGGLVGLARYIAVDNCSSSGLYSKSNINYTTHIGGLIGSAQSSTISNSGSSMQINVNVSSVDYKYIGVIVGNISAINSVPSTISNCYITIDYYEKTELTTSAIKLGIYGNKDSSVTITGCYKKEN